MAYRNRSFPKAECLFCGAVVELRPIPPVDEDRAWDEIAKQHGDTCPWATSRAGHLHNYGTGRHGADDRAES